MIIDLQHLDIISIFSIAQGESLFLWLIFSCSHAKQQHYSAADSAPQDTKKWCHVIMWHEGQTGATVAKLRHRREFYHWKLTLNYYFPCCIFTSLRFDLPATSISPKQCMYVSYTIENKVLKLKKSLGSFTEKELH